MFYVYEWFNVETGEIIYVGKGSGRRYLVTRKARLFNEYLATHRCDVRIVEYFDNEDDAFVAEYHRITQLKLIGECVCNKLPGGYGGLSGVWTEEKRALMSANNPMKAPEQRARMSKHNPMKNQELAKLVAFQKMRPVVVKGRRYDSIVEAADYWEVYPQTVTHWAQRGYDTNGSPCRYADEDQKEFEYVVSSSRKVWVGDMLFRSVKEAANYMGWYSEAIIRAIKANRPYRGYICRYDDQQPTRRKSKK